MHFSMTLSTDLIANDAHTQFNNSTPAKSLFPIVLGGQSLFTGSDAAGHQLGMFLADRAERGGTVGPWRFKVIDLVGNHINSAGEDVAAVFSDIIYHAIVKMEYNLDEYRATGDVVTNGIPDIIHGTVDSFGANSFTVPFSDLNEDCIWRDIAFGVSTGGDLVATSGQISNLVETVDQANFQYQSWARTVPWTVIRTKRRLKENEGLFFVTNVVSGQPSFVSASSEYEHSVQTRVYGMAAARIR